MHMILVVDGEHGHTRVLERSSLGLARRSPFVTRSNGSAGEPTGYPEALLV
jgi:hypothetical protein